MSRGGSRRTSARSSRACRTHATVPSPPHTRTRRSGTLPAYRSSASRGPRRPMSTTSRALRSGRCARSALSSSPRRPPLLPLTKMRRGGSGEGASKASDTGFAGAYARGGCGPRDASRRADATGRRPVRGRINWRRREGIEATTRPARARGARAPEAAKDALVDVDVAWESIEIGARSGAAWRRASRSGRPPLTRRRSP